MTGGDAFFKQYDRAGRTFMAAQLASPPRDHRRVFRRLLDGSLKGRRLLDAGCGYGHDLPFYAARGATVYGTDPSSTMIRLAEERHPGLARLSVQPIRKTAFRSGFFDLVTSIYALHNEPNLALAFREIHRILKPGGLLLYLVQHPLFVLRLKRKPAYHAKETVLFTIPDMRKPCTIRQPAHTFSEYFAPFVLQRFELLAFAEGREPVPMWFLAKLRKRQKLEGRRSK
jgi:SAM-dependent methyltransferase